MSVYILNLTVTEQGAPFYPPIGTVEHLNGDNAGYDLKVVEDVVPTGVPRLAPLGVKAWLQQDTQDCHFSLEPRSSIYKTGFIMANSRGIIDKTYRGQLMAPMVNIVADAKPIEAGTRVFQIVAPDMGWIQEVRYIKESDLPTTARGEGGFGSTGTK
jgi:dUTP pyrophosphatase